MELAKNYFPKIIQINSSRDITESKNCKAEKSDSLDLKKLQQKYYTYFNGRQIANRSYSIGDMNTKEVWQSRTLAL